MINTLKNLALTILTLGLWGMLWSWNSGGKKGSLVYGCVYLLVLVCLAQKEPQITDWIESFNQPKPEFGFIYQ